jgi:mycoredoxin
MDRRVTVYGVDECKDTRRTRAHLDALGVAYEYVNLEEDPEAERRVREWNDGKRRTPTLVLEHGARRERLSVPSDTTLDVALDRLDLMPDCVRGDGSPGLEE